MAKNKVEIDVVVDDKGTTKKVALGAKQAADNLDKTAKSAGTVDRNIKGTAQASANATKNFSKMSQGMGGLVSVYATIAANVFALSAAFEFLKRAAEVKQLQQAQIEFAANTGLALQSVTLRLREASNGMLGFREAAQAAAIGVAKGFSPEQLDRLAQSAARAAAALGRDFEDAFDRLVRGVSKAEPELLDELGVTLRLEKATKDYATALGLQADSLTDAQKSQAILLSTQKQLDAIFGTGAAPENKYVQLGKTFSDLIKDITQKVLPVFDLFADIINKNAALALGAFAALSISIISSFIPLDAITKKIDSWGSANAAAGKAAEDAQKTYRSQIQKTIVDNTKLLKSEKGKIQSSAQLALAQSEGSKKLLEAAAKNGVDGLSGLQKANLKKATDSALKQLEDTGKITTGIYKGVGENIVRDIAGSLKAVDAAAKTTETKFKYTFKNMGLTLKIWGAQAKAVALSFATTMAGAFQFVTRQFVRLLSVLSGVGLGLIFYEMYLSAKKNLDSIILMFTRSFDYILQKFNSLMKMIGLDRNINENAFTDMYNNSEFKQTVLGIEEAAAAEEKRKQTLEDLSQRTKTLTDDTNAYIEGLNRLGKINLEEAELSARDLASMESKSKLTFAGSAGFSSQLEGIAAIENPDDQAKQLRALMPILDKFYLSMGAVREIVGEKLPSKGGITADNLKTIADGFKGVEDKALKATASLSGYNDKASQFTQVMSSGDASGILLYANDLYATAIAADEAVSSTGEFANSLNNFKSLLANKDFEEFKNNLQGIIDTEKNLLDSQSALNRARAEGASTGTFAQRAASEAIYEESQALHDLRTTENQLKLLKETSVGLDKEALVTRNLEIDALKRQKAEQEDIVKRNEKERDIKAQIRDIDEQIRAIRFQQNILQQEQDLLNLANKRLGFEKELLSIREKVGNIQIDNDLREERETNMFAFLDEDKRAAEAKYNLEKSLLEDKKDAIENERLAKLAMIDLEYKLLDAKLFQTEQEFKKLALDDKLTDNEKQQAKNIATKIAGQRTELPGMQTQAENVVNETAKASVLEIVNNLDKLEEAKNKFLDINQIQDTFATSLESNMNSAFNSIVDGTKSAKQAFADMAIAILQDISQMIVRMLIMKAIMATMNMLFPGSGTIASNAGMTDFNSGWDISNTARYGGVFGSSGKRLPGYRYGGISKMPGYAVGGIARGSDSGYPVMLHGTEAVVPLPNGKSIPVDMKGAGQNNNVVVNVSVDNQGRGQTSTESQSGADAGNLGQAIARAVQQELQNQKRSGGILNPYGVA
jgi:hypothetical protein